MSSDIQVIQHNGESRVVHLDKLPDKCPRCHHSIRSVRLSGYISESKFRVYVAFICPDQGCDSVFLADYGQDRVNENLYCLGSTTPVGIENQSFPACVAQTSPDFVEFYNQAYRAEQFGLKDICGTGYRKALEFLLKDYLIKNKQLPQNEVSKAKLGECIKKEDWITDSRLKLAAKGATWLGNDHTHYENKHPESNLDDLKKLIQLTVIWVESEILTMELTSKLEPEKVSES